MGWPEELDKLRDSTKEAYPGHGTETGSKPSTMSAPRDSELPVAAHGSFVWGSDCSSSGASPAYMDPCFRGSDRWSMER